MLDESLPWTDLTHDNWRTYICYHINYQKVSTCVVFIAYVLFIECDRVGVQLHISLGGGLNTLNIELSTLNIDQEMGQI